MCLCDTYTAEHIAVWSFMQYSGVHAGLHVENVGAKAYALIGMPIYVRDIWRNNFNLQFTLIKTSQ